MILNEIIFVLYCCICLIAWPYVRQPMIKGIIMCCTFDHNVILLFQNEMKHNKSKAETLKKIRI